MPRRVLFAFSFVILSSMLAIAGGEDPKDKVLKVKEAYNAEIEKLRTAVIAGFDKKEEKARSKGDKKTVDEVKQQRAALAEFEEWPADMPVDLRTRLTKARTQIEAAYTTAIKECTKAKKDEEAAALEKEFQEFRTKSWSVLDLTKVELKDGFFRIPPNTMVTTRNPYKGGVEIMLVAKTEAENIRLYAHRGASVIFNWEGNLNELRVTRPDGREEGFESGSLMRAKVVAMKPDTYYTLKWWLTPEGMTISENGQVVFSEKREYDLTGESKIAIQTKRSRVDVKEIRVTRIGQK
ncbi:MAG TPA: hypothetical protein VG097_09750 [Gemmata sp.]|nr:hypothetical protein [Gemmata sp.]